MPMMHSKSHKVVQSILKKKKKKWQLNDFWFFAQ